MCEAAMERVVCEAKVNSHVGAVSELMLEEVAKPPQNTNFYCHHQACCGCRLIFNK